MNDDEFLTAIENCTLPFEQWTHRAHVRVAFLYASRFDLESATDRMRASVKAYNKATETLEAIDRGYHETITQAFMRLVFAANVQTGPHVSSDEFCETHPELLTKYALRSFYSREHIMTMEAKARFVEPVLCPLPIVVGESITIINVEGGDSLAIVKRLFVEFAKSLDFDLCFQGFNSELAELPGAYALPTGRLFLARTGDKPAGCVALRPLSDGRCEMKRLWVRSDCRGTGLGRQLANAVIDEARRIEYVAIRLDTVPSMAAAISLYRSLGFVEIEPYTSNPIPGALFMELKLKD
jgi:ribosomal protein S18 acetylase RimI-like enzyme